MWTLKPSPFFNQLYSTSGSTSIYWTNVKVDKEKKEITQLMNLVSCKDFILDYFYSTYEDQHADYTTVPHEDHWILIGLNPSLSAEKAKEAILDYMNKSERDKRGMIFFRLIDSNRLFLVALNGKDYQRMIYRLPAIR